MRRRPTIHLTYANVMSTVAVFAVLAGGGAYAASKIGPGEIQKNAVQSKHIVKKGIGSSEIAPDAVLSKHIKNGEVKGVDVFNGSLTGTDVFDDSLTGKDVADGSIERVDLDEEAQGPAGFELRDNDTGEICNDGCTEGTLELPPGFYAIFGKIVVQQEEAEFIQLRCELTSGGVVFDSAEYSDGDDDVFFTDATLPMQGLRLLIDRDSVNLNCMDSDSGSLFGSQLKITAIKLGSATSSTP